MDKIIQSVFRLIWEILIPLPMPWRIVICLILLLPILSWLIFRGVPWLLATAFQVIFTSLEFLAKIVLGVDNYLLTSPRRKKGLQPLHFSYIFGDVISTILMILKLIEDGLLKVRKRAFNQAWLPRFRWFGVTAILVPLIWFVRPAVGEGGLGNFIDQGGNVWESFEGWVITGNWTPLRKMRQSPEKFIRGYFNDISKGQLKIAWSKLSSEFQNDKKLMPDGYTSYEGWWVNQVQKVEMGQANLISEDIKDAQIYVNIKIITSASEEWQNIPLQLSLKWDFAKKKWLIDKSK
ncbi:Serine/threonine protein kinase [Planktothrix rubescens]|nr:Serine/threonine protein kinase [Planktothrix rubescens]